MSQREDKGGIQVVCAGLGRTGTLSLAQALNILGFNTYHFIDFMHHSQWAELAAGTKSSQEIIDLIVQDGYDATLENPTCDIYQDILKKYPNAKVILTVRDSPESFCKSWKTLFDTMVITESKFTLDFPSFFGYIPLFANLKKIRYFMGTTHLKLEAGDLTHGWRTKGDAWLADQYRRHNEHVQFHVSQENLLKFNVKEGWEPLCKFLNKEIPDEPFPKVQVNTTSALLGLRKKFRCIVYLWIPTTLIVTLGATMLYIWGRGKGSQSTTNSL